MRNVLEEEVRGKAKRILPPVDSGHRCACDVLRPTIPQDEPAEWIQLYSERGFGKRLGDVAGVDFVGLSGRSSVGRVQQAILSCFGLFALAVLLLMEVLMASIPMEEEIAVEIFTAKTNGRVLNVSDWPGNKVMNGKGTVLLVDHVKATLPRCGFSSPRTATRAHQIG